MKLNLLHYLKSFTLQLITFVFGKIHFAIDHLVPSKLTDEHHHLNFMPETEFYVWMEVFAKVQTTLTLMAQELQVLVLPHS